MSGLSHLALEKFILHHSFRGELFPDGIENSVNMDSFASYWFVKSE